MIGQQCGLACDVSIFIAILVLVALPFRPEQPSCGYAAGMLRMWLAVMGTRNTMQECR